MRKKDEPTPNISEILDTIKRIELLIEDNNQNIRDCYSSLKLLEKNIGCGGRKTVTSVIRKILNKMHVL